MPDPSLPVQQAIFAQLDSGLSVAVFDEAPEGTAMPYAQIGDDAYTEDDAHAAEDRGWIGTISIEVWDSTTAGRSKIKAILSEIDDLIHDAEIAVTGYDVSWIRYQTSNTSRANDRPHYVGTITFEIRLEPSPAT